MKNILTLFVLVLLFCSRAIAQISLEHTTAPISPFATAVLFSASGTKIMANDTSTVAPAIKLYNTDYSLWKSIPVPVPAGKRFYMAQHVSDKLFNTDGQVEAFVVWYSLTSPVVYHAAIIDESGSIIHDLNDGDYYSNVYYIDGAHKLFVHSNTALRTKIYSLPGELPCGHCGAGSVGIPKTAQSGTSPMAYPNPASGDITIVHNLPVTASGMLTINGADGKSFGTWPVSGREPQIIIDVKSFPAGFYTLTVLADGIQPTYGSFVK